MAENSFENRINYENTYSDAGFTLIEVLVAIAIFGIGMLAIASMQIGATQSTTTARLNTELTAFATDQMERLIRLPFDDPELEDQGQDNPHQDNLNDPRFSASWVVEDDEVFTNTKTVTLTAEEDRLGNNRALILEYVVPRR